MLTGINLFKYVADLAFPRVCISCGRRLCLRERHLCAPCLADMPRTFFSSLSRNPMADRLNERFDSGPYAYATALFYYCGNYVELTKSLKFRRNFAAGAYFSSLLAAEIRSSPYLSDIDFVTCVPLHWTRKFQRGYNQAEIIAVRIAAETGACFGNVLVRTRRTARQARIGGTDKAQARWKNVSGSFKVRNAGKLKGYRHILVVDDVFTTGATLYSCFAAVRNAVGNDVRISVATLAYAGGR